MRIKMNKKCYNCINYDAFNDDCVINQYDGCSLKGNKCTKFSPRKQCTKRYECCENNCSIICHRAPSEAGCRFDFKCKIDDYACDERCQEHENRKRIKELQCRLSQLNSFRATLDVLLKECKEELESLK